MGHGDGHAQPGASVLADTAGLDLEEGLEHPGHELRRDADARVLDAEADAACIRFLFEQFDPHADRSCIGELDRVARQIQQDAVQGLQVAEQRGGDGRIGLDMQGQRLGCRHRGQGAQDVVGELAGLEHDVLLAVASGLDAREVEQLLDLDVEPHRQFDDRMRARHAFRIGRLRLDQGCRRHDPGQRRAQFVTDLGQQLRLGLVGALGEFARILQLADQHARVERHHGKQHQVREPEQRLAAPVRRQQRHQAEAQHGDRLAEMHRIAADAEPEAQDGEQIEADEQRRRLAHDEQPCRQHEWIQDRGQHQQVARREMPATVRQPISRQVVGQVGGRNAADFPRLVLRPGGAPPSHCGQHQHDHEQAELQAQSGLRAHASQKFRG